VTAREVFNSLANSKRFGHNHRVREAAVTALIGAHEKQRALKQTGAIAHPRNMVFNAPVNWLGSVSGNGVSGGRHEK
jgi:hypothetical protein